MLRPEILSILPDALVELYLKAEADILADMARRIRGYNCYIPAAIHQMRVLEEMGMVREIVLRRLGKLTGQTEEELKQLMLEAGEASLRSDDEVYRRAGLNPPPLRASSALRDILQAGLDQTAGTFQNLTGTTANTAAQQFERALDRTWMQISMGGIDYNTAVANAIKDLAKDGIKAIRYPSGREDSLETAVRRAAVTGINQTMGKLQMARLEEMEWDLVETTAHAGARPSHAVWQGRIFSIRGSGNYPDFYQSTGYGTGAGLCGWNCSHSFRPWQEGMSRIYTPEMLEAYEKDTVSYNGEQIPRYEALQKQRTLERNVRRYKRENLLDGTPETAKKLKHWQSRLKDFTEQTGLKRQSGREMIPGFGKNRAAAGGKQNSVSSGAPVQLTPKQSIKPSPLLTQLPKRQRLEIEKELSVIPQKIRQLAETRISRIILNDNDIGSNYTPKTEEIILSLRRESGDVIHEYGHALEKALDLYHNQEFLAIRAKDLQSITADDIMIDMDRYTKTMVYIDHKKFVSRYQGMLYYPDELRDLEFPDSIRSMWEYFSEGFMYYFCNAKELKAKDPDLFNFIRRIMQ